MTTREISDHLKEIYDTDVSPSLISNVTNSVKADVDAWRTRPLEHVYPIIFLDAMFIKVRTPKGIVNKPLYLCMGINQEGYQDILGMWLKESEGPPSGIPSSTN